MRTRDEHLAECKRRALEYVDAGDALQALTSMCSDLGKHPETENHPGIQLGFGLLMIGRLRSVEDVREFIEGFH